MRMNLSNLSLEIGNDYTTLTQIRDAFDARIKEMQDQVTLDSDEVLLVHQGSKVRAVKLLSDRMHREGRESSLKFCKDVIWAYAETYDTNRRVTEAKHAVIKDTEESVHALRRVLDEIVPDLLFKHKLS